MAIATFESGSTLTPTMRVGQWVHPTKKQYWGLSAGILQNKSDRTLDDVLINYYA